MSILTEKEIDYWVGSNTKKKYLARAIESAVLTKLAGMELPKPVAFVTLADVRDFGKGKGESSFLFEKYKEWNIPLFTADQLHLAVAQGVARDRMECANQCES